MKRFRLWKFLASAPEKNSPGSDWIRSNAALLDGYELRKYHKDILFEDVFAMVLIFG